MNKFNTVLQILLCVVIGLGGAYLYNKLYSNGYIKPVPHIRIAK